MRFFRLGLTAFGGPAMVPFIRAMAVDKEQWISEKSFRLGMAMTQAIPGATAMQIAAYVGLRSRGGPGALAAYVAFGLPAFVLMLGLSALYVAGQDIPMVMSAYAGLGLVVVALILHASINFSQRYLNTLADKLLATLAGVWLGLKGNPILALVVVCLLSVVIFRQERENPFAGMENETVGRPLFASGVILACLLVFLGVLEITAPELADLGWLMAKIDCFAFGGGYVSVPLMLHEVVEARGWLTLSQFMDGIALGQVTPGPIVMTGAFVGYLMEGVAGAVVSAITVFTPSLIFVCAATPFADRLAGSPLARRAFKGSLVTLVGLMAAVAARLGLSVDWGVAQALLAGGAFVALRMGYDILWVVVSGAVLGALIL